MLTKSVARSVAIFSLVNRSVSIWIAARPRGLRALI